MSIEKLRDFVDLLAFDSDVLLWIKRLAGNDTQQTGSHQAGPYIRGEFLFAALPELDPTEHISKVNFDADIVSHDYQSHVVATWYSSKNEGRITRWGGLACPLLDPEMTGAAAAFVFGKDGGDRWCKVWLCETEDEADFLEERFGAIEPGRGVLFPPAEIAPSEGKCHLDVSEIPSKWLEEFPSPVEIFDRSLSLRPDLGELAPDQRIVDRRDCEFELFRSIESAVWLPRVSDGFASLNDFIRVAQSILQRRKARSGKSLERHLFRIFAESGMLEGIHFDAQVETETGKKPDFLFPSETAYHDLDFDSDRLRMLGVKTTLRERWRQVLEEADRIPKKHIFTLQEGVTESQYAQMRNAKLTLVVPKKFHRKFPESIRPDLLTLEAFLGELSSHAS